MNEDGTIATNTTDDGYYLDKNLSINLYNYGK